MALPDRKPSRLKNFSYSSAGAYFITICIAERAKILCDIVGGGDLDAPEVHPVSYTHLTLPTSDLV